VKLKPLLLALLTSVLLLLSFPPFGWGFLGFIALLPLWVAIRDQTPQAAFGYAYLSGLAFFVGLLYWIVLDPVEPWVVPLLYLGVLLIAGYLGLFIAAYAGLTRLISRRTGIPSWLAGPFLFMTLEFLRSLGWTGFPWGTLGYTQTGALPFVQFAEWTGVWGVTFWVLGINHLALEALAGKGAKRRASFLIGILLWACLPLIHGLWVMNRTPVPSRTIRIALIQGNIFQDEKWQDPNYSLQTYDELSREAARQKPDLIIWPETAVPCFLLSEWACRKSTEDVVTSLGTYLLTGAEDWEPTGPKRYAYYNAGFLFAPDGALLGRYHKRHLVPFGESIPFKERIPWLRNLQFGEAEWSPGGSPILFLHPKAGFSLLICFESIFPDEVRRQVKSGARLLVNITNDSWFGRSGAAQQHAQMAVFRAIENRISLARCANSGISMFVDPLGRSRQSTGLFVRAVAVEDVPLRQKTTFYTSHGDLFAWGVTFLSLLGLLPALFSPSRKPGRRWGEKIR